MDADFILALNEIEREKGIPKSVIFDALKKALEKSYEKNFNDKANVIVEIDEESGKIDVFSLLDVVEDVHDPVTEILLDSARNMQAGVKVGDVIRKPVTPKDFGRISAQTARNIVIQKIKDAEREVVYNEFADRVKETTATTGTGAISMGGAAAGYRAFSAAFSTADTVYYCIEGGAEWEVGIGTLTTGSPWTMARTTVLASSNAGALVSFGAGTKSVFCTAVESSIGYRNVPQNSKSTNYTLVLSDAGKHILHPSADTTARTFTIPKNSSVAYEIGTALTFVNQNSAGVLTIAITTDTMRLAGAGTTGSRTLAANSPRPARRPSRKATM